MVNGSECAAMRCSYLSVCSPTDESITHISLRRMLLLLLAQTHTHTLVYYRTVHCERAAIIVHSLCTTITCTPLHFFQAAPSLIAAVSLLPAALATYVFLLLLFLLTLSFHVHLHVPVALLLLAFAFVIRLNLLLLYIPVFCVRHRTATFLCADMQNGRIATVTVCCTLKCSHIIVSFAMHVSPSCKFPSRFTLSYSDPFQVLVFLSLFSSN